MLVQVINRYNSEVMPEVYVIIEKMDGGLWEIAPVSDMTQTIHYHTKSLKEVICE
tara:strand:- start:62 stop:226 length:165 start_codon:yes stop_codon:yes gene_type:complete